MVCCSTRLGHLVGVNCSLWFLSCFLCFPNYNKLWHNFFIMPDNLYCHANKICFHKKDCLFYCTKYRKELKMSNVKHILKNWRCIYSFTLNTTSINLSSIINKLHQVQKVENLQDWTIYSIGVKLQMKPSINEKVQWLFSLYIHDHLSSAVLFHPKLKLDQH